MTNRTPRRGAMAKLTKDRTPLFQWMRRHHATIAARIAASDVSWSAFTTALVASGFTDAKGNPPQPVTVKMTWNRVCADVAARPCPRSAARASRDPVAGIRRRTH